MSLSKITDNIARAFDVEELYFRRYMSQEEIRKLTNACSLAFSEKIHTQVVEKIMHYCYYVERNMSGRAAGNIEDLIIRYLIRYFASLNMINETENTCHMEIGALFGAATIYSCHANELAGKKYPTVVIDPFEGYYGQDVDSLTKLEVNEEIFWSNINRFGFDKENVHVIKGLSSDEKVIESCKKLKILSLIIDGDHTYDGVKKDWINYSDKVVTNGYVLFDDYNSISWPEVTEFVNNEILLNLSGRWKPVLVYGNSLILKRTNIQTNETIKNIDAMFHSLKDAERIIEIQKKTIYDQNKLIERINLLKKIFKWNLLKNKIK